MQSGKRNLDIDLLRTLIAIADSGSFSVAASQLGRTQSAVSLQIKRLEEIVGQCLLARAQGRASRPTAEGELLIEYGRRILRLNDEACNCFDRPTLAGKLRLGLPEELMEGIFHHVLTDFSSAFPKVELSVRCDFSVRLSALIETGELDLALIKRVVKNDDTKDASSVNSLRREPLVWFTGNGSDASKQRPLPLALFHEGCVFRTAATSALAGADLRWRTAFVGSSFTALRHAVVAGMAIAPLPRSLASAGLIEIKEGLPPLPDAELISHFAAGPVLSAAHHLALLFRNRLQEDIFRGAGLASSRSTDTETPFR